MIAALDSSVIIAALDACSRFTPSLSILCINRFARAGAALTESFSTMTGGRLSARMSADDVARALRQSILPRVTMVTLTPEEYLSAIGEARVRGVRGGAIHDYLPLVAARQVHAERFYTLHVSGFRSFHRSGDPEIVHP